MKRILWFALKLAILIAALAWLADRPGVVAVQWGGWIVETSTLVAVVLLILLAALVVVLDRLWRGALGLGGVLSRRRAESRRLRGYRALSRGMAAAAAGEASHALRYAREAERFLDEPPLTLLLAAQAAQLNGDERAAETYFKAMLNRQDMEFLGLRGLLTQAMRRGDDAEALRLARRARELKPEAEWIRGALVDLEARVRDWPAAERALKSAVKAGQIEGTAGRRKLASIALAQAEEAYAKGDDDAALDHARRAGKLQPDAPPAPILAARALLRRGKRAKAEQELERAWTRAPHPDLAMAYADLVPDEAPLDRVRRLETLTRLVPDAPDGHLAVAEAALAAKLWGAARAHLDAALDARISPRAYRLYADVERLEKGDEAAARGWLAKAADAPPEERWICDACAAQAQVWTSKCPNCGTFDSLAWRLPTPVPTIAAAPEALPAKAS